MFDITRITLKEKEKDDLAKKVIMYVDIVIDNALIIKDAKIIEGSKGPYLAYPSRKDKEADKYFEIVHPVNKDTKEYIQNAVFDAYNEYLAGKKTYSKNW